MFSMTSIGLHQRDSARLLSFSDSATSGIQ
jgi:hypothetical protein